MTAAALATPTTAELGAEARASNEVVATLERELAQKPAEIDAAIDADDAALVNRLKRREGHLPRLIETARAESQAAWAAFHAAREQERRAELERDLAAAEAAGIEASTGFCGPVAEAFGRGAAKTRGARIHNAEAKAALRGDPTLVRSFFEAAGAEDMRFAYHFCERVLAWMAYPPNLTAPQPVNLSGVEAAAERLAWRVFFGETTK